MSKKWFLHIGRVQLFLVGPPPAFFPVSMAQYESDKPVGTEEERQEAQKVCDFLNRWDIK